MGFTCDSASPCLDNGPFSNLSAELADPDLFGSLQFGPVLFPPLGGTFKNPIPVPCYAQASTQDLADAAAQNCVIGGVTPPGPPGSPTPPILSVWNHGDGSPVKHFGNAEVQCEVFCPDGLAFTWTVAANYFQALDPITATRMAQAYACKLAYNHRICLSSPSTLVCLSGAASIVITATGGKGPYLFQIVLGSLPPGLSLTQNGSGSCTITGTPTATGNYGITLNVTDANGNYMVKQYTIDVIGLTNAPDPACQGSYYSFGLAADGGALPYTFSLLSGSLPAGLDLAADGTISGTPTQAGAFTFAVEITDANAQTCQATVDMSVQGISNLPNLPSGTENAAYSVQLQGTGGIGPYTYSLATGSLPSGLSVSLSGLISGTVAYKTASNTPYSFGIRVTDSTNISCVVPGTMTVGLAPGPNWLELTWPTYQANQSLPGNTASGSGASNTWNGQLVKDSGSFFPSLTPVASSILNYTGGAVTAQVSLTVSNLTGTAGLYAGLSTNGGAAISIYDPSPVTAGTFTFNVSIPSGTHTFQILDVVGTAWAKLVGLGSSGTVNFSAIIYNL